MPYPTNQQLANVILALDKPGLNAGELSIHALYTYEDEPPTVSLFTSAWGSFSNDRRRAVKRTFGPLIDTGSAGSKYLTGAATIEGVRVTIELYGAFTCTVVREATVEEPMPATVREEKLAAAAKLLREAEAGVVTKVIREWDCKAR